MAYILMFLAGIAVTKLFQTLKTRRKETSEARQRRWERLNQQVRGKNQFNRNAYNNWQEEVLEERRKPNLAVVEWR